CRDLKRRELGREVVILDRRRAADHPLRCRRRDGVAELLPTTRLATLERVGKPVFHHLIRERFHPSRFAGGVYGSFPPPPVAPPGGCGRPPGGGGAPTPTPRQDSSPPGPRNKAPPRRPRR